jgi:pimeloyl-ACP methyl ester carboxylesterase
MASATAPYGRAGSTSTSPKQARARTSSSACTAGRSTGTSGNGWIGFLLCLKAPERFERYLALNILHPWLSRRQALPHAWRFWYQLLVLSQGIGYRLHSSGKFVPRVLVGGSTNKDAWDEATLRSFADNLAEPARARAAVQMYRVFNLREVQPILGGRYADRRLTVPTRMLFRDRRRRTEAEDARRLRAPRRGDDG